MAVGDDGVMQGFDLESLLMGLIFTYGEGNPMKSDYGSKDYVNLSFQTVFFRIVIAS